MTYLGNLPPELAKKYGLDRPRSAVFSPSKEQIERMRAAAEAEHAAVEPVTDTAPVFSDGCVCAAGVEPHSVSISLDRSDDSD